MKTNKLFSTVRGQMQTLYPPAFRSDTEHAWKLNFVIGTKVALVFMERGSFGAAA
jgi:hypothetical protein